MQLTRWLCKGLAFAALTAVVLNPNLKRAVLQVCHTLHPEKLIETNFPALSRINAEVDQLVATDRVGASEARVVARFVLRKIKYVTDYENWSNVEYWPTAEEAWQKGQEDCDGRAILATSILRSRGFRSARMVIGLDHMWIRVDENEKDASKPAHFVALLSPNPDFSLELHEHSRFEDLIELLEALLHPAALGETLAALFAEIPAFRKVILILGLLGFCYHPCKDGRGLLPVLVAGLGAAVLLAQWQPDKGDAVQVIFGSALLTVAIAAALSMERLLRRPLPASEAVFVAESA